MRIWRENEGDECVKEKRVCCNRVIIVVVIVIIMNIIGNTINIKIITIITIITATTTYCGKINTASPYSSWPVNIARVTTRGLGFELRGKYKGFRV